MVRVDAGDRVVEVTRAQGRGGAPAREEVSTDADGQLDLLG